MVQRRNGAGLLLEPAHAILVGHQPARQNLEGDLPPKPQILGEVDLAHPAGAERRHHAIVRKFLSGGECVQAADYCPFGDQLNREVATDSTWRGTTFAWLANRSSR
ncbi:MAG: hypothetical protein ACRD1Q_14770, partial [Vicinamibacterales bacterium]